jgi:hypothetical protein
MREPERTVNGPELAENQGVMRNFVSRDVKDECLATGSGVPSFSYSLLNVSFDCSHGELWALRKR